MPTIIPTQRSLWTPTRIAIATAIGAVMCSAFLAVAAARGLPSTAPIEFGASWGSCVEATAARAGVTDEI